MTSKDFENFDPFQVFEVSPDKCAVLYVRVIKGEKITKGYMGDLMDTPDPYVILNVKNAPNAMQRTRTIDNDVDPEWDETFKFYVNPKEEIDIEITLMDSNYLMDEILGDPVKIDLSPLPYDKIEKTLSFKDTSKVEIEMWAHYGVEPQLRFSLSLCDEERTFIEQRKKKVFESMKNLLGEGAPKSVDEVPIIGVIGSGGGFRAMTAYSGVMTALVDTHIIDMCTYVGGLSGSAWYLSQLYSNPEWPKKNPRILQEELGKNIAHSPFRLLGPQSMYSYVSRIIEKRRQGQPVSFTDFFGHLVGETLLKNRQETRLTDQQNQLKKADIPMPLYTCLHVKKHVSAMFFHEWMEFTPYEIGLPKYGTFMKSQLFGSKFFMGQLVKQYPEPPLHFLMGVWGSAFCIQFNRLLNDDKKIHDQEDLEREREELGKELLQEIDSQLDEDSETSESEDEVEETCRRKGSIRKAKKALNSEKKNAKPSNAPFWHDLLTRFFSNQMLKTIEGRAAKIHSFMRGLSMYKVYPFSPFTSINKDELNSTFNGKNHFKGIFEMYPTTMKKLYVVDGGLTFNSPYPLLLRPQRHVNLILSFDFSGRPSDTTPPFKEIELAERWARLNKVPFPRIDTSVIDREGRKECYVFEDPDDPKCPIVLHFVLANITFRDEVKPGVPRTTEEEKEFAEFDIFDDPERPYSTFNFTYSNKAFERLSKLTEFNTLLFKDLVMKKIKECVERQRLNFKKVNRPIKLMDIKKLKLADKRKEEILRQFVRSFDEDDDATLAKLYETDR